MEIEAELVTGRAMSAEAKMIVLTNAGSGSERDRADGAKTIGWIDVKAWDREEWVSGVAHRTEEIYGQAFCRRQEACGNIGLNSGQLTSIK